MPIATRITKLFGCRYPIQQAGMGGLATADLAIAVARAGGIGMLSGTGGRHALATQLDAVASGEVVGVNFLVPFLDRAALMEAAARSPLVEFFWATPDVELVEAAHEGAAQVGWQVGSVEEAKAARDVGCDLIIAQGMEAGGHVRGTVAVLPLLDEICSVIDLPVIAAGGIGSGRGVAAALAAGADAVRMGTRFIAAQESTAHPVYVDALINATAADTVLTTAFGDGWPDAPHRVLKSCIDAGAKRGAGQSWSPEWPSTGYVGSAEGRAHYAGQSVGSVHSRQTAAQIIAELMDEVHLRLGSPLD